MNVNAAVIAALVFGILSFVGLVAYLFIVNIILPNYNGAPPWNVITFYITAFALFCAIILNISYSSLSMETLQTNTTYGDTKTPTINTVFIITLMSLLSVANILVGYTGYLDIGTSAKETTEYLQLLLPANLFISTIAVAIIMMQKLSGI